MSIDQKSFFIFKIHHKLCCGQHVQSHGNPLWYSLLRMSNKLRIYVKNILKPLSRLVKGHFEFKNWTFMQNGSTSYAAKLSQEICKTNFINFWHNIIWAPCSLDINPPNYSIRDISRIKFHPMHINLFIHLSIFNQGLNKMP